MIALARDGGHSPTLLQFDDNRLLPLLYGEFDQNLIRLEHALGVRIASRGNQLAISGAPEAVETAVESLKSLYARLQAGYEIGDGEIDSTVQAVERGHEEGRAVSEADSIRTRKKLIAPRNRSQKRYIQALRDHELTFGLGPAGTGKTYLAVAAAVEMLLAGRVERLILSRPAVEAGERLGFLPGDMRDKVDPYLRPLYDALYDMLPGDQVSNRLQSGEIEVAPLAFMRGRTLSNAFVILDEAQNTTTMQMKMFLTRLGESSRMAINGDLSQIDLPRGQQSGLDEARRILSGVNGISFVQFTESDVVRHPLVMRIVRAYAQMAGDAAPGADLFEGVK